MCNGTWTGRLNAKCNTCSKQVTGKRLLAMLAPFTGGNSETVAEAVAASPAPSITDLIKEIKALREELQAVRRENTNMKTELSDLRDKLRDNDTRAKRRAAPRTPTTPLRPPVSNLAPQEHAMTASVLSNQEATQSQPSTPATDTIPSWADAVRKNLPVNRLQQEDQDRLRALRSRVASFRPVRRISTEALYFRARRGPIGELRRALKESLPPSALLNLSFIGQGCLEIVCNTAHKGKLVYVMNKINMSQIKEASVLYPHGPRRAPHPNPVEDEKRNVSLALKRVSMICEKLGAGPAKSWYEKTLASLKAKAAPAQEEEGLGQEKETPDDRNGDEEHMDVSESAGNDQRQ